MIDGAITAGLLALAMALIKLLEKVYERKSSSPARNGSLLTSHERGVLERIDRTLEEHDRRELVALERHGSVLESIARNTATCAEKMSELKRALSDHIRRE